MHFQYYKYMKLHSISTCISVSPYLTYQYIQSNWSHTFLLHYVFYNISSNALVSRPSLDSLAVSHSSSGESLSIMKMTCYFSISLFFIFISVGVSWGFIPSTLYVQRLLNRLSSFLVFIRYFKLIILYIFISCIFIVPYWFFFSTCYYTFILSVLIEGTILWVRLGSM